MVVRVPGPIDSRSRGGGGVILQVVQGVFTATTVVASEVLADTGITVNITPGSTSSKVLIIAQITTAVGSGAASGILVLLRDSTQINIGAADGNRDRGSTGVGQEAGSRAIYSNNITYLDSPATVSQVTYKIQFARITTAGSIYINRSADDTDDTGHPRTASNIIAMEIAG